MKSRTSFFNGTVLRKDIFRYAPVWGLYAIGMFLILFLPNMNWGPDDAAEALLESLSGMTVANTILGGICALTLFSDLFKTRLCYATHALPLRREGWFLTHYTAGILFSFVPNLLIAGLFCIVLKNHCYMAALWLGVVTLQYLFFFGTAAFSAVCAGNRLGAAACYLILNFFAMLIGWYAEGIYQPLLYGMEFNGGFWDLLIPMTYMANFDYLNVTHQPFTTHGIVAAEWIYLAIVAGIGLIFTVLALLRYRKRHLETAGDFLSFPAAKPVFWVIYTLAIGYLFRLILSDLPLVGLFGGLVIGFFTGKMLLERTVKVFQGRNFLFFGVLVTVLFLSIGLTFLDPAGVTRYVPKAENVEVMYFYTASDRYKYQNEEDHRWEITDPAEIEAFCQFHEEVSDGRYRDSEEQSINIYVQYQLVNGQQVLRNYEIPVDSEHGEFTRQKLSTWQAVFHSSDWDALTSDMHQVDLEIIIDDQFTTVQMRDREQVLALLEAIRKDCNEGNMAQSWAFHQEEDTSVWVYIYETAIYDSDTHKLYTYGLNIYESCRHTLAYLDSLDLDMETYSK